ncbi:hypothetical protein H3Z83_06145 [Tenacibaculum sp. S7007]|uniref:Uncharacterized protein n=1 Tax=Tenacibaculum pelagium TaxID=2759527 RepID=A0A839AP02_9FLAO|nr:hypothetical protein [Tenacibaculum pelagium]MBA6156100.1 hypothetical protein [Tenacibaculum pelagium]
MFKKFLPQDLIFLVVILIVIAFTFSNKNVLPLYNQLNKKEIKTVGFIKKLSSIKTRKYVEYKYSVRGKTYNNSQQINRDEYNNLLNLNFYPIVYHNINPEVSKLLTSDKPLLPEKLISEGVLINGKIINILEGHKPYIDFYIDYMFEKENYSFRTKLHQDSLNCGTLEKCRKNKVIKLKISKEYPFFNNLYFKSRDRQKRRFQHLD